MSARPPDCDFSLGTKPIPMHTPTTRHVARICTTCLKFLHKILSITLQLGCKRPSPVVWCREFWTLWHCSQKGPYRNLFDLLGTYLYFRVPNRDSLFSVFLLYACVECQFSLYVYNLICLCWVNLLMKMVSIFANVKFKKRVFLGHRVPRGVLRISAITANLDHFWTHHTNNDTRC